jgi:hypothetical protein
MNRLHLGGKALADPVSYVYRYGMAYPKPSPTGILCSLLKKTNFPSVPQLLGSRAADARLASAAVRLSETLPTPLPAYPSTPPSGSGAPLPFP